MNYKLLIGDTLFDIDTPKEINWKKEEIQFFWYGDTFVNEIRINIQFVKQLPEIFINKVYSTSGLKVGYDKNQNEVRIYTASFISTKPVYALSVLKNNIIQIYFKNVDDIWNNPNIRLWNLVHMEQLLLNNGGLVFHCSYLVHGNKAILFSAPSGTGKTTQAKLWEKNYSSSIINGDKTILQKKNGVWYARGYPFHGSADECANEDYPVKAIVIVRQNKEDYIEEMNIVSKIMDIYSEITVNSWDEKSINKSLDLISKLCEQVTIIKQHCTMNDSASRTLHEYLYGGE